MVGNENIARLFADFIAPAHFNAYERYYAENPRPNVPRPVTEEAPHAERAADYCNQSRQNGDYQQDRERNAELIYSVKKHDRFIFCKNTQKNEVGLKMMFILPRRLH